MKTMFPPIEPLESRIAPSVFLVTTTADTADGLHDTGSLRDALAKADVSPGADIIKFKLPAPAAHSENIITLNNGYGELTSLGNVTITGPGAGKLIINGNGNQRVFDLNDHNSGTDSPATISGISMMNGNTVDYGGAIYSAESLTLKNVVISGSSSSKGGGALCLSGGVASTVKASITGCLISGNSAKYGGGLYLRNLASATISQSVISGNSAAIDEDGGGVYLTINGSGKGASITNSQITGNTGGFGGGLYLKDYNSAATSKITVSHCTISGNISKTNTPTEGGGGGIYAPLGNFVVTATTIENNTAVYNGGGIAAGYSLNFSLAMSGCTISGNTATSSSGYGGGGIFLHGNSTTTAAKITGTTITGNYSGKYGGGVYAMKGLSLTISGCTVSGNTAQGGGGGGVSAFGYGNNKVDLTISGGVFSDNIAGHNVGGGIFAQGDGAISITGAKVTGNHAAGRGAGIFAQSSAATVVIKGAVVSGNLSDHAGGGLDIEESPNFLVTGGSVTGNGAGSYGGGVYIFGTLAHPSSGSIKGVTISGNTADAKGGGVYLGSHSTLTLQTAKVTGNSAPTDPNIYGNVTPFGPTAVKAPGATKGNIIVTTTADETDPNDGVISVREALAQADLTPDTVDTIGFALPASQLVDGAFTIQLGGTELSSMGNVKIVGPGAGKLIIDAGGNSRVFHFDDGDNGTDRPVSISGLSILNGNVSSSNVGAGIDCLESLTVSNVVIAGCQAADGAAISAVNFAATTNLDVSISNSFFTGNTTSAYAGALDLEGLSSLTLKNSVLTGNTATNSGGGAYIGMTAAGKGLVTVTGCQISGNSAYYGGGLRINDASTDAGAKVTITSTKFNGNTIADASGKRGGAGLFLGGGKTTLTGCIIDNNTAKFTGGGIEAKDFTSITISKCTISGNRATTTNANYQGGGGVFLEGDTSGGLPPVLISKSLIADNRAALYGGGLFAENGVGLTISGTTFSGNNAASDGGGVFADGHGANMPALTVTSGAFADNVSGFTGGGVWFGNGTFSLTGSKITGNTAAKNGGGIYASTSVSTNGVVINKAIAADNFAAKYGGGLDIRDTTNFLVSGGSFTGNTAVEGGGIYLQDSSGDIEAVTISGNIATSSGGGVFNHTTTLNSVTLQIAKVIANSAPLGPDVYDTPGDLKTFTFV